MSDDEKSAAKEIKTGKRSIHIFNYNDKSTAVRLTTEPIDYSAKLCAGNLAIDDERGMERGGGNQPDYSNEAEG